MSYLEALPRTTVKVSGGHGYMGSGVLVTIAGSFYVITAAHVVFECGNDAENLKKLSNLKYESEEFGDLMFLAVVGTFAAHQTHDIVPIKVHCVNSKSFPKIDFCSDVSFPGTEFIFRGTEKSVRLSPHSVNGCVIDTISTSNQQFELRIPAEDYSNSQGESGAEVLQGYSGSGVFFQDSEKFWLTGIVLSVGNDNFNGVICRSVSALKSDFFPELELKDFHGGNQKLKVRIADLRKGITKKLIEERKNDSYGDIKNLTRKMNVFLPQWTEDDLDQFITDILLWDKIDRKYVRNSDEYQELIDDAKALWASGNKKFSIKNAHQGNAKFHQIQDEFNECLVSLLEGTPLNVSSKAIVAGEVSKMLANCSLDFWCANED